MLQPNELERCAMMLSPQMEALEMRIMEDIVRRIRINGEITSAADWQMNRLYELGMSKRELKKILQRELGLDKAEISHMYRQVLRMGYARSKELYKARGKPWIPFYQNAGLQLLINAVAEQTTQTIQNITQSLGFAVRMPNGHLAFQPIADYYQKTLDSAVLDIASGAFDYNTVLKRTVKEMTNSGLRTVDYATGHSNRVEVAARRAVMTGLTQLTDKVTEDNARELETDMWEITWHSGFRPEHWWGGRWYSSADLVRVCGYGTVTGLCGANCYHQKFPVIPGVSVPAYSREELDRLNAEEQKPREFGGKTYTKYEALQHQRRMETTMRAQRQEIKLLQDGGAAEEDVIAARARYRGTSAEYARFSQAVDLPQQRERVTVDGLGNIGQGKYTGGSDRKAMRQRVGSKITGAVSDQERAELLEHPRMVLTNPAPSDIIREEIRKPITLITDAAVLRVPKVSVSGMTEELNTEIQKQHKELLELSRSKNSHNEVAFVFDSGLGNRREFFGKDDSLEFGQLYGRDLFIMHNHPRNSSFSATDIIFMIEHSEVKTLSIVKNNGAVEVFTKTSAFNGEELAKDFARIMRKTVKTESEAEYAKAVQKLLEKHSKEGGMLEWVR